jgi:RimJ/RimL family protein N-acetyltransferase
MIRGRRVTLRPFRQDELPLLRRWHDDGAVMIHWGERLPLVVEDQLEADLAPGSRFMAFEQCGLFCICDETACPLGRIHYEGSALRDRRVQLGIFLGEPDAWNQGYGTEAVIVLLNWLFNHRGMHRVWLTVQANNARARHVYERIGFVAEGVFREHNFYDGHWHDEQLYGLLAAEFNARYRPEETDWLVSGELR